MNFLLIPPEVILARDPSVNVFLITCIDRVDAPPASTSPNTCLNPALKKRNGSNPLCVKNLESSTAIIAFIKFSLASS